LSASRRSARIPLLGILLVALAAVGFSAKAVIVKLAYAYPVDAVTLLALRMMFSAPFFVLMALWSRARGDTLSVQDWKWVALLGFVGYYLASYLDFLGLQFVTASLERLILFLYPTMVLLLSAWLLKTPVRRHHFAALALSYGGIALVFRESLELAGAPHQTLIGAALVFASGLVYSFYLVGVGGVIARLGAARFTAYAMLVACAACVLQFLLTHGVQALHMPLPIYGLALLMAVFSTVLPAWFMAEGIRRVGASHAAMIGSIGPVSTILLSNWILDETISLAQLGGVALVLIGVSLASLNAARLPPTSTRPEIVKTGKR
jgi:drug/metabolite transporter (DMT)-like permease